MITFVASMILLVLGYVFYGRYVEKVFGVDENRKTPAYAKQDGIDYIPMPLWKVFLIQFLNIAGTGPIFGAIGGILFGPMAFIWIVVGCIFVGATHDFTSGMLSLRKNGASLPEIIGDELGMGARQVMRVFTLFLLIMVGTVFVTTPASLLATITEHWGFFGTSTFWCIIIFCYYILATLLPIDALIGKIYPLFGLALLIMAVGVMYGVITQPGRVPEITGAFVSHHPNGLPIFPFLFITIACGAISGFHATQTPMMARCLTNEKYARFAFYGAMITEGFIALIWAAAAIKYYDCHYEQLAEVSNPAKVVGFICNTWLGRFGAILAVLGVVAAPITSGDTAFRSARLLTADFLHFKQNGFWRRLIIAAPLFVIAIALMNVDFAILWRYFGWANQTLSIFTLWTLTAYFFRKEKNYWIVMIPAIFMTMVCTTYILIAPEGLSLSANLAYILGGVITAAVIVLFAVRILNFHSLVRKK